VEGKDPMWRPVVSTEGEMVLCWSEEGETWDGSDQTVVLCEIKNDVS